MLDNSVWEKGIPVTPKQLCEISKEIGATHVLAPDYLDDLDETVCRAEAFMGLAMEAKKCAVVQGRDTKERIRCYVALTLLGYKYLCFPLTPKLPVIEREAARVDLLQELKRRRLFVTSCEHHLMSLDVVAAIWEYKALGIQYLDTRLPLHIAQEDEVLTEASVRPLQKKEIDLTKPFSPTFRELCIKNVSNMQKLCEESK